MRIERFCPGDLKTLMLQPDQEWMRGMLDKPEYGIALSLAGPAFSAFDGDQLLGCGGVVEFGKHRAEVWALLSSGIGPHMKAVTRAVNGWLSISPYKRVEAHVEPNFKAGLRWIRLLGFRPEGVEKAYFFGDGRPALPFVRLKE